MLTQRQLEKIADEFGKRMEKIVQQYLQAIGEHIRDIGKLLPSDVQKLVEMKRMGINVDTIKREIAAAMEAASRDVERVFYETAETDYRAAQSLFGESRNVPLRKNAALMRTLKAYTRQTLETLSNLSNTTVVSTAYRAAIDRAVQAAQSGVTDYASAVRQALKEAATDGLRVQYASGVTRRLDSAVHMNVLDGIRQLNQDITIQTGKEYGADGVELSAHRLCAEDHLPYQGRQFSNKEFQRLQTLLERPIGMWNCRHFAFPIILGVSEPAHSQELLENYRRSSQERITIDGVTKTRYEWTQQQRKLETAVRRQKDIANTAKAAGDDVLRREAQYKIERYQAAYDRITNKALLTADRSRMRVSGFSSVKAADDETMRLLRIERQRKTRLANKPSLALPGADKATAAEAKFTKYLFNPEKPDGYAKGVAFESRLGYNIKNWEQLRQVILEAAKLYPASVKSQSPYGTKYEQKIILHGLKGNPANVKLGWIIDKDGTHLTTAFIEEAGDE